MKKTAMIPGFKNYEISDTGIIINIKTKKEVKLVYSKGYALVGISNGGKRSFFLRHRLVADAFIPNPDNKPLINHKNGIKSDNRVENLEWCTHAENVKHAYKIGLNKKGVENCRQMGKRNGKRAGNARRKQVMDTLTNVAYSSVKDASISVGVTKGHLSAMLTGRKRNTTSLQYYNKTYNQK